MGFRDEPVADVPEEETPAVEAAPQPDEPMDVMTALQQVITGMPLWTNRMHLLSIGVN